MVPSIPLLTAQILALTELPEDKQLAHNPDDNNAEVKLNIDLEMFGRFATEEICRRSIKKDVQPMNGTQIMDMIYPDRKAMLDQYKIEYNEMLKAQTEKSTSDEDAYAEFK